MSSVSSKCELVKFEALLGLNFRCDYMFIVYYWTFNKVPNDSFSYEYVLGRGLSGNFDHRWTPKGLFGYLSRSTLARNKGRTCTKNMRPYDILGNCEKILKPGLRVLT